MKWQTFCLRISPPFLSMHTDINSSGETRGHAFLSVSQSKKLPGEIADDTMLMAESEEELKESLDEGERE